MENLDDLIAQFESKRSRKRTFICSMVAVAILAVLYFVWGI